MVDCADGQGALDNLVGLKCGLLFRQLVTAFGHQRIVTIHQLLDLLLVVLQRIIGHLLVAFGHLLGLALLLETLDILAAVLDVATGRAEHDHQALPHFVAKVLIGRHVVRLVLNQGDSLVRIDHDLLTGLIDRVLHLLLRLLFRGVSLGNYLPSGGAVGRRSAVIVALEIDIALTAADNCIVSRLGNRAARPGSRSSRPRPRSWWRRS